MGNSFKKISHFIKLISRVIIPYDLEIVFDNMYYIITNNNKKYILLWVLFLPIMIIYCIISLFVLLYYLLYYNTLFIFILIQRFYHKFFKKPTNKSKKKFNKKIRYKKTKTLSNNNYIILIKIFLIEKPNQIVFNIFYTFNNLMLNWKEQKKELNIKIWLYIIYVFIFRFLIFFINSHTFYYI